MLLRINCSLHFFHSPLLTLHAMTRSFPAKTSLLALCCLVSNFVLMAFDALSHPFRRRRDLFIALPVTSRAPSLSRVDMGKLCITSLCACSQQFLDRSQGIRSPSYSCTTRCVVYYSYQHTLQALSHDFMVLPHLCSPFRERRSNCTCHCY